MQFDVVSLFPEMFAALTQSGVTRRAFEQKRWDLALWNPRDFTTDRHRTVDDRPYGGGPGMVMLAKPLKATIGAAKQRQTALGLPAPRVVFMSPQGRPLTHERVMQLKDEAGLVLLCCAPPYTVKTEADTAPPEDVAALGNLARAFVAAFRNQGLESVPGRPA